MKITFMAAAVAFFFPALTYSQQQTLSHQKKAVILVVVDQLGTEPFSHYSPKKGLKTLSERGAYYSTARYPYLHPETCPGHATIATGTYPWKHGIVSNNWKTEGTKKDMYCLSDSKFGASPKLLLKPTLGDILKVQYKKVRVLSIGGKDRSAVMLGGKHADQALWFDKGNGKFKSSKYYPKLNESVGKFNSKEHWRQHFSSPWRLPDGSSIPHGYGLEPDGEFFGSIYRSPALDQLTMDLFLQVAEEEIASHPNSFHLMALALSSLDNVGHRFGSHSLHYRDALSRVDDHIEKLFSFLDKQFGTQGYILALTGDHGAFPMENPKMRSVNGDEVSCARMGNCSSSETICFQALNPSSRWFQAARHSYYPGRGENCVVVFAENLIPFLGPGTSHITPHPFDTDVPLWIIGGNTLKSTNIVSPASITPTVLRLLGMPVEKYEFDEKPLSDLLESGKAE